MLESRFTYEASRGETGLKKFAATGHHFAFVFVNKEDGIRYNGPRKVGPTAVTLPRLGEPAPRRDKRFTRLIPLAPTCRPLRQITLYLASVPE